MFVLAIALLASGILVAVAFGTVGIAVGSLMCVAGAVAFWSALRRLRRLADEAADATQPSAGGASRARPGWQLFLIIVASVVVTLIGLIALFWKLTEGLAAVCTGFFEAVKSGDMDEAHGYLSKDFRKATSDDQLAAYLKSSKLAQYESASWTSRYYKGRLAEIAGTVTTKDGTEMALTITLIREEDRWKIIHMARPDTGLVADAAREQPSLAEQQRLVGQTTRRFVGAIEARDFTEFHGHISDAFKAEADVKRLNDAFVSVMVADIDLQPVIAAEPEFTTAGFDTNGYFGIEGNYPLDSKHYYFRYSYVREAAEWKLVGINVQIR